MRLLRQPLFLAVAFSHFAVDALSAQVGILLAVFSTRSRLDYAAIGLIATLFSIVAAVAQPAFGWLADRNGGRWTAVGGLVWIAACMALVVMSTGPWPIFFLVVAALGTSAFHPPAALKAAQFGNRLMGGQAATAASIFFLFGQVGWGVGPAAGGLLIDHFGPPGILVLTGVALAASLLMAWQPWLAGEGRAKEAKAAPAPAARPDLGLFALAIVLVGLPSWALSAAFTFAPKLLQDQGVSPTIYGLVTALFMIGSAAGGVLGAMLSDRWNRKGTLVLAMAGSALPLFFFPAAALAESGWMYGLALAAGLTAGAPHSILFIVAQRAMPGKAAFASGVALGLIFSASAVGTYLSGLAADQFGLVTVLQANAALSLLGAALCFTLKPEAKQPLPQPALAGD
jgi:FSR family fosmidomycin resistance protein-like MFS transporter